MEEGAQWCGHLKTWVWPWLKGLIHCVVLGKSLLLSESTFPHEKNGLESMILEVLVS